MSFSVNTNTGAMTALQYLNETQGQLNQTQNAINSGLKVASAKDDGAIYAIAQNQRGAVAGFPVRHQQPQQRLIRHRCRPFRRPVDFGPADPDEAEGAFRRRPLAGYREPSGAEFGLHGLRDQISTIVKNAVFNNFNLVDGSTNMVQALASADGTRRITTAGPEHEPVAARIVTLKSTATVSTQAKASALIATIQASLTNVNSALAKLSAGAAKFSIQAAFTQKLSDTLTAGIGNLVDANMAQESASLQSLQVKQQLGVQALSIANQAPQTILSLFQNG